MNGCKIGSRTLDSQVREICLTISVTELVWFLVDADSEACECCCCCWMCLLLLSREHSHRLTLDNDGNVHRLWNKLIPHLCTESLRKWASSCCLNPFISFKNIFSTTSLSFPIDQNNPNVSEKLHEIFEIQSIMSVDGTGLQVVFRCKILVHHTGTVQCTIHMGRCCYCIVLFPTQHCSYIIRLFLFGPTLKKDVNFGQTLRLILSKEGTNTHITRCSCSRQFSFHLEMFLTDL